MTTVLLERSWLERVFGWVSSVSKRCGMKLCVVIFLDIRNDEVVVIVGADPKGPSSSKYYSEYFLGQKVYLGASESFSHELAGKTVKVSPGIGEIDAIVSECREVDLGQTRYVKLHV